MPISRTAGLMVAGLSVVWANATLGRDCISPPNEDCDGAIVFTSEDLPYSVTAPLGCVNDVVDKPYFDIFYRYDCTQTGQHVIDMCDSDGDTYIRIYTEGCGWSDGVEFATADDECPGSPPNADPLLHVELEAGNSYWFELGTWRAQPPWAPPENSPYNFNISLVDAEVPELCDASGIPMALVGDPGNAADTNGNGSVANLFRMAKYEITNRQYADFLNSVGLDDPNALYSEDMTDSDRGGILRGGAPGSYVYWVKASFGDKPVNFITWLDAARFCNWLHNGKPSGPQGPMTTEAGTYTMSFPNDQIVREPGARWFIPTSDEWYKAAYYDPFDPGADGGGTTDYWEYPTKSDTLPVQATADAVGEVTNPGVNVANYGGGADWNGENGNVTTVGGTTSESPWGAFDMGGNLYEMTETPGTPATDREHRGGDFSNAGVLMKSGLVIELDMTVEAGNFGFRVAAPVCPGDFDGDNDVDEDDAVAFQACFTGGGGGPLEPLCAAADFDGDGDADCDDWEQLLLAWTASSNPPTLPDCDGIIPTVSAWGTLVMALLVLSAGTLVYARRRLAPA